MNCSQIFCTFAVETTSRTEWREVHSCELLSNFLYFCSRNNWACFWHPYREVVNCSQIFCTFAVETTLSSYWRVAHRLWIALKFFVLLQSKQRFFKAKAKQPCCELLSNFLYFCSRNNKRESAPAMYNVVNCSQIFCTFAVETTNRNVNILITGCELLSNFLYFCSRNNALFHSAIDLAVVNCSQIFCTFAVETTYSWMSYRDFMLWIALKFFVLLQSKQQEVLLYSWQRVVNCSQIFCTFAVETTPSWNRTLPTELWIALKFFVLLQSKQQDVTRHCNRSSCELLSNFLYFCSRNNPAQESKSGKKVVNCSQIFCTFAVETTTHLCCWTHK